MNRKANSVLCKFSALDPFVKCYLIKTYCLSLYGCALWSLSSPSIRIAEIALNKNLRKVWNLPRLSHSSVVHCTSQIPSVFNSRFCSLHLSALSSSSSLLRSLFAAYAQYTFSFTGYNYVYGFTHCKHYCYNDVYVANTIRQLRYFYGFRSPCEGITHFIL